jgi:PAS domain S-box-containing protein
MGGGVNNINLLDGLAAQIPGVIYQFRLHSDGRTSMPYASARLYDIFGVWPEQVKEDASLLFELIHPDDREKLSETVNYSAQALENWDYEFRLVFESGLEKWVKGSAKPEKQKDESTLWLGYIVDVTDKKKTDREIEETRERFGFYFEKAPEGFFVINKNGKYLDANPATCLMTGFTRDELLKRGIFDLMEKDDHEKASLILKESFLKGQSEHAIPLRRKNGDMIWLSLITARLSEEQIIGFCFDITEKVEAKRDLEMQLGFQIMLAAISSNFVNATICNLNDVVDDALARCGEFFMADRCYVFQFSGGYTLMSNTHEWCALGVSHQKENLQDFSVDKMEWWSSQIKEKKTINISDVCEDQHLSEFEKEFLLQQEIQSLLSIPMIANGVLMGFIGLDRVKDKAGWSNQQINQFNVVGEIISGAIAKHKAEVKLRKSESRYRLLAENARDMIYRIRLKPDRYFEYVSPSATHITGYTPEEHYADSMLGFKIVHPDDKHILLDLSAGTAAFDKPIVLRWVRKDGSVLWCEQRNVPIFDESGELIAIEGIARDVTEQKNIEERLKVVNAELWDNKLALESFNRSLEQRITMEVEKNRNLDQIMALQARQAALGEMIGNIAHQWRQPLNAVSLGIMDLAEAFEHGEISKEYFDDTIRNINRILTKMSCTLDDFRNYFKPQSQKKLFQLKEVIESALDFVSADMETHEIKVEKELNNDVVAFGYSNELLQVIINILQNARDSIVLNSPGDRKIHLRTFTENSSSFLEIFNTGPLIPAEHMIRLFDPYFTTKDDDNATGLGLYIAKTIIEKNMNGRISCFNQDDGVRFVLELTTIGYQN